MKTLTVCQPYAEMIASGAKRIENRTWPTRHRGPLAIHAGRSRAWLSPALASGEISADQARGLVWGAVVATCRLVGCFELARIELLAQRGQLHDDLLWIPCDRHAGGPWLWIVSEVVRLADPVPVLGQRGLWDWDGKADPRATAPRPARAVRPVRRSSLQLPLF